MVALGFLILIGAVVLLLFFGPMVVFGFIFLGSAAVSLLAGSPMAAVGFLILGGAAVSLRVARPIHRVHGKQALAAHLVFRLAASLVLGVFTVKAARYDAARYRELESLLLVPGVLAVLSFASASVLVWAALADSGTSLCRVRLHRWIDVWSDAGLHRACVRCGVRETPKRRASWAAALLGAFAFALVMPAATLAVGVYVAYRPLPNYSLARSTACWLAHGYRVSRDRQDRELTDFPSIEIRGHHDLEYAIFAPSQVAAWNMTDEYSSEYGPPSVPVRNVVFGAYGTFHDKPILACLRASRD